MGVCVWCVCGQACRSHRLISVAFPRSCPPWVFRQSHWDLVLLRLRLSCLVGEPQGFTVPNSSLGSQACAVTLDTFFFLRLQYNYTPPCARSLLPQPSHITLPPPVCSISNSWPHGIFTWVLGTSSGCYTSTISPLLSHLPSPRFSMHQWARILWFFLFISPFVRVLRITLFSSCWREVESQ